MQWKAFNAHLRGLLIKEIVKVKRNSSGLREELVKQVHVLEERYVQDPNDSAGEAWQSAQSAYERLLSTTAEKAVLFQTGIL